MKKRTPSRVDVAGLGREDWESLCRSLCSIVFGADGVEDSHGKGNGLDSIARLPEGVEGWQHRRFDGRFLDVQAGKVRDAMKLASKRCLEELGVPLVRFTLVANIDLEPGHRQQEGEIQRWERVRAFARDELNLIAEFRGVTWVTAQLLLHPNLHPGLFEDLETAIEAARASLSTQLDIIHHSLSDARQVATAALARLLDEGRTHYDRGQELGQEDQLNAAARCLEDALRLVDGFDQHKLFCGRVLVALAGVELFRGRLLAAQVHAERAIDLLDGDPSQLIKNYARGTLALVLAGQQHYGPAESHLRDVLHHFEAAGDIPEIVRTLTHLAELELNRGNLREHLAWAARLLRVATALEAAVGPTDLSFAALGAVASGMTQAGRESGSKDLLRQAESAFEGLEAAAKATGQLRLVLVSKAQRAQAIWFQDRNDAAANLYAELAREAAADFGKIAADAHFNRGLILRKTVDISGALEAMTLAAKDYEALGDLASRAQALEILAAWSRGE